MIVKAEQKNSRQTPTRLRLVANAVKRLPLKDAMAQLEFMNKKAARTMLQVFKQAVANATKNLGLAFESLKIREILVGEGPRYKRYQPVSRGQAHAILKRTAHIRVVLESSETEKDVKKAKGEKQAAAKQKSAPKAEEKMVAGEVVKEQPQTVQRFVPRISGTKSQTVAKTVSVRKTGER